MPKDCKSYNPRVRPKVVQPVIPDETVSNAIQALLIENSKIQKGSIASKLRAKGLPVSDFQVLLLLAEKKSLLRIKPELPLPDARNIFIAPEISINALELIWNNRNKPVFEILQIIKQKKVQISNEALVFWQRKIFDLIPDGFWTPLRITNLNSWQNQFSRRINKNDIHSKERKIAMSLFLYLLGGRKINNDYISYRRGIATKTFIKELSIKLHKNEEYAKIILHELVLIGALHYPLLTQNIIMITTKEWTDFKKRIFNSRI